MPRFLLDFDGTMTNPVQEAERVRDIIFTRFVELSGVPRRRVMEIFDDAERSIHEEPWLHGWKFRDRITAFSNEDPFIMNHAIAECLDSWASATDPELRQRTLPKLGHGYASLSALAEYAFGEMLREVRAAGTSLDPDSIDALRKLLDRGNSVVLVSNSAPERIIEILRMKGFMAVAHDRDALAPLRIRGWARKFQLGDAPRTFMIGNYKIDIARPAYEEVLRDEKPDVVIGDVFTLDLALPFFQRAHTLYLRGRTYTPSWSQALFLSEKATNLHFIPEDAPLADALS